MPRNFHVVIATLTVTWAHAYSMPVDSGAARKMEVPTSPAPKVSDKLNETGYFFFSIPRTSATNNDPGMSEKSRTAWEAGVGYRAEGIIHSSISIFAPALIYSTETYLNGGRTDILTVRPGRAPNGSSNGELLQGYNSLIFAGETRDLAAFGPAFGHQGHETAFGFFTGLEARAGASARNDLWLSDAMFFAAGNFSAGYRIGPFLESKGGSVPFTMSAGFSQSLADVGPVHIGLAGDRDFIWSARGGAQIYPSLGKNEYSTNIFLAWESGTMNMGAWRYDYSNWNLDLFFGPMMIGFFYRDLDLRNYPGSRYGNIFDASEYGIRIGR